MPDREPTPLTERLRDYPDFFLNGAVWVMSTQKSALAIEAADEIDRLNLQLREMTALKLPSGGRCAKCGFRYLEHEGHIIPCPRCALRERDEELLRITAGLPTLAELEAKLREKNEELLRLAGVNARNVGDWKAAESRAAAAEELLRRVHRKIPYTNASASVVQEIDALLAERDGKATETGAGQKPSTIDMPPGTRAMPSTLYIPDAEAGRLEELERRLRKRAEDCSGLYATTGILLVEAADAIAAILSAVKK